MSGKSRISVIIGALALAAVSAGPAWSKTVNLGTLLDGAYFSGDTIMASTKGVTAFTDDWEFTLAALPFGEKSVINAQVYNANQPLSIRQQILGLTIALYSGTPTGSHTLLESMVGSPGTGVLGESRLIDSWTGIPTAGETFYIQVSGSVPKNVGGKSTILRGEYNLDTVIQSIPEPATWAMMLIGFGFVGFQMRRRSAAARASLA